MPTEQELISRTPQPATRASLARQMRENGLTLGGTVLVHSSLSSLGWVAGGPVAVIQALLDCVGPQGTIVMPTHSGDLTDPADWRSPPVPADWVQILRNEMPAYDPQTTPTRNMGAVAELFRACRKHFWRQLSPSQGRYSRDGSPRRVKGLETADLRHVLLHPEMVALNPLLEMFGHIMHGIGMEKPIINRRFDR